MFLPVLRLTRGDAAPVVDDSTTGSARWLSCLAALALVLGVTLRVVDLGGRALVFDEAYTWALARRSFAEMVDLFTFEANGTLYPILLWPVLRVGETEELIRSVSLVFGVGAIAATYLAAMAMLRDRRAALFSLILISASPMAIGASQAAKGSSLSIMLVAASYWLLALSLRTDATRDWLFYGLSIVLVGYAGNTALLALAGQPVMAAAARSQARRWAATVALSALALLPLAYITYASARERDSLYWETSPTVREVGRVVEQLTVWEAVETRPGRAAFLLACCAAVVIAGFAAFGPRRLERAGLERLGPLLAWTVAPLIGLLLISQAKPIFEARYLEASIPGACILAGALLARMPARLAVGIAAGLVVVFAIAYVDATYTTTDYRTADRWLATRSDGSEPVLMIPVEQLPSLEYYVPSLRGAGGEVVVEEWGDALPGRIVGFRLPGGYGDAPTAPPPLPVVERLAAQGTFFVFAYRGALGSTVDSWLAKRCEIDRAPVASLDVERLRC